MTVAPVDAAAPLIALAPPSDEPVLGVMLTEVAAMLAAELCLAWVFARGYIGAALAAHFLLCGLYWKILAGKPAKDSWRREQMRKLLALSTAALGPFGAAGALLTLIRLRLRHDKGRPFDQWHKTLFPTTEITRPDFLHRLLVRSGGGITGNVSPFADIMAGLDDANKRTVLSLIIDYFIPEYVPALRRGLTDADPTIRVSAATVMASIEGRYLARGIALEGLVARDARDGPAKRKLADHLDDYAYSGLVDPIRAAEMRDGAIDLYRQCMATDPEIVNRIGRLQIRLGRIDDAGETYAALPAADYLPALPWRMEVLFRQGRFDELRQLARGSGELLAPKFAMPAAIRDAVREWAEASE